MAVFHGDKMSENAVACSLAIQDVMIELGREYAKAELDIGIGVDVGEVVVGAMGSSERMDYTVLGDHVNVAARLCSSAAPKQTLISESVHEDIENSVKFAIRPLRPIKVKGKSKALRVFAVSPPDGSKPKRTPARKPARGSATEKSA